MDAYTEGLLNTLDRLGLFIFKDDEKDFPRFAFEGHPSPVHHWQVGLAMRGGAALTRTVLELVEVAKAITPAPVTPIGYDPVLEALMRQV